MVPRALQRLLVVLVTPPRRRLTLPSGRAPDPVSGVRAQAWLFRRVRWCLRLLAYMAASASRNSRVKTVAATASSSTTRAALPALTDRVPAGKRLPSNRDAAAAI